jgi:hypothetical protein
MLAISCKEPVHVRSVKRLVCREVCQNGSARKSRHAALQGGGPHH